jgi:hypothetical protein
VFTKSKEERGPILPLANAGKRTTAALITNVRTMFIDVVLRATITIATASVTAIRNRGRGFALLSEVGVSEGGRPTWQLDPRVLAFQSEQQSPSKTTITPLSALTVGTYLLVDRARLAFAHPYARDPRETWYTERNPLVDFSFYALLDSAAAGVARLVQDSGTSVTTLTALSLTVQQIFDRTDTKLPVFLPQTESIVVNVAGANRSLEIPLKYSDRLRSITITQDTDAGEVTDIINAVTLRGDNQRWIENVAMDDLARDGEYEQGGDVYQSAGGRHAYINFQTNGKLTAVLNPLAQDNNLRLVLDVQPSASGTVSRIIVTLNKLVRDPFVGPDMRRVVDPNPSFPLI